MNDFETVRIHTPAGLTLVADVGGPIDSPAVILLHGGGQTRHSWAGAMRELIARGYRVINYDALHRHHPTDRANGSAFSTTSLL